MATDADDDDAGDDDDDTWTERGSEAVSKLQTGGARGPTNERDRRGKRRGEGAEERTRGRVASEPKQREAALYTI